MTGDKRQRIVLRQHHRQARQAAVLRLREAMFAVAFKLDANRKVVAALTALKARLAGVPSARVGTDKLQAVAATTDQKMSGNT